MLVQGTRHNIPVREPLRLLSSFDVIEKGVMWMLVVTSITLHWTITCCQEGRKRL